MLHIILHFVVPLLVARVFYSARWLRALLILVATMLVDLDHLRAEPIYDPERCSIGFHPLHTPPAIAVYCGLFALGLGVRRWADSARLQNAAWVVHLVGLGLVIHMVLDGADCLAPRSGARVLTE